MKQKTHSGLKKRIRIKTKKGKLKLFYQKAARNHLMINKSKKQKGLPTLIEVSSGRMQAVRRMMPHA